MRNPQPAKLKVARAALTAFILAFLIWFGIAQTQRDNKAALRHAPVVQPGHQLKQSDKESSRDDNQDYDVGKIITVLTFLALLVQSYISGRQVALMRRQTDIYDRQAGLMQGQLNAATTAANAANTANIVSRETLAATRRPWVSVVVGIGSRGLYYDTNGVNLHLAFILSNTGSTPATYVQIIGGPSLTVVTNDVIRSLVRTCDMAREKPLNERMLGFTVFPGQVEFSNMVYSFANCDTIRQEQDSILCGLVIPYVLGCVDYVSVFDKSRRFQSRFAFRGRYKITDLTWKFKPLKSHIIIFCGGVVTL